MTEKLYSIFLQYPDVQTDTRKLAEGSLFFALKGPHFNGNHFAATAVEKGAALAVIDDPAFEIPGKTILVKDSLAALQQLALHHRKQFNIPFIAITGSNGKTTTKELVHAVLSTTLKTYTTEGNLNNHIGVPLTLLRIKKDAELAVIEMGANHQKEIESYCKIALPTHGLITNCGKAHLEGFGGEKGVRKGKGELFDHLKAVKGTAFVMWDYSYLREMSEGIPEIIRYGIEEGDITGNVVQEGPFLTVNMHRGMEGNKIRTRLVGDYNLPNILAAVAVGNYFGVRNKIIIYAIENYAPSNSRSQWLEKGSNRFILDSYNANPSSMKLAIENFVALKAENKILMLGAMAELGEESLQEHQSIVDLVSKHKWKEVVLVGGDFLKINHPYTSFENSEQARSWYNSTQFKDSVFLIKGSRSVQMEKITES